LKRKKHKKPLSCFENWCEKCGLPYRKVHRHLTDKEYHDLYQNIVTPNS